MALGARVLGFSPFVNWGAWSVLGKVRGLPLYNALALLYIIPLGRLPSHGVTDGVAIAGMVLCAAHLQLEARAWEKLLDVGGAEEGQQPVGSSARSNGGEDDWTRSVDEFDEQLALAAQQEGELWDERYAVRRMTVPELRERARGLGLKGLSKMKKADLIAAIEKVDLQVKKQTS